MSGDRPDAEPEHGRYRRIVAAAGICPDVDLSPEAQVVLAWLARQDDTVADGIVEIVGAASEVACRAALREAAPRRMRAGQFGGDPGHSGP
jgi:hypothetical protein